MLNITRIVRGMVLNVHLRVSQKSSGINDVNLTFTLVKFWVVFTIFMSTLRSFERDLASAWCVSAIHAMNWVLCQSRRCRIRETGFAYICTLIQTKSDGGHLGCRSASMRRFVFSCDSCLFLDSQFSWCCLWKDWTVTSGCCRRCFFSKCSVRDIV